MSEAPPDPLFKEKAASGEMFDRIYRKYDFLNHLLTLRLDLHWRTRVAKSIQKKHASEKFPVHALDLAAGTGDMAVALYKNEAAQNIVLADISSNMLGVASAKLAKAGCTKFRILTEDAGKLSFSDSQFDEITIAFGVRNFPLLENSLRECFRVLKPGGSVSILEFGWPGSKLVYLLFRIYSATIIPLLGILVARDRRAYGYLTKTISTFPYGEEFILKRKSAGFVHCNYSTFSAGIVYCYRGEKDGDAKVVA